MASDLSKLASASAARFQLAKRIAPIVEGFGEVRLDGQSFVVAGEGIDRPIEGLQNDGVAQESRQESSINPQRRAERRKRLVMSTLLVSQNAEKIQHVKAVRPRLENPQIQSFSSGKIALAMQIGGLLEQLRVILRVAWTE